MLIIPVGIYIRSLKITVGNGSFNFVQYEINRKLDFLQRFDNVLGNKTWLKFILQPIMIYRRIKYIKINFMKLNFIFHLRGVNKKKIFNCYNS